MKGLEFRVSGDGRKTWSFRYRTREGRQGRVTLGVFVGGMDSRPNAGEASATFDLARARVEASRLRVVVDEGKDPAETLRARKEAAKAEPIHTFDDLAETYFKACERGEWAPKGRRNPMQIWNGGDTGAAPRCDPPQQRPDLNHLVDVFPADVRFGVTNTRGDIEQASSRPGAAGAGRGNFIEAVSEGANGNGHAVAPRPSRRASARPAWRRAALPRASLVSDGQSADMNTRSHGSLKSSAGLLGPVDVILRALARTRFVRSFRTWADSPRTPRNPSNRRNQILTAPLHSHTLDLSRRSLFGVAALLGGAGALLAAGIAPSSASAAATVTQKAAKYQAMPKGAERCDNCLQWQPPSSCKVVEGSIDPAAWCALYGPKPKS